jgi:hypothetical protein
MESRVRRPIPRKPPVTAVSDLQVISMSGHKAARVRNSLDSALKTALRHALPHCLAALLPILRVTVPACLPTLPRAMTQVMARPLRHRLCDAASPEAC